MSVGMLATWMTVDQAPSTGSFKYLYKLEYLLYLHWDIINL